MDTNTLITAARHRVAHQGVPKPTTFMAKRVVVDVVDHQVRWAPAGLWIDLCEAVEKADNVRDGADLDDYVDLEGTTVNLERMRPGLIEKFDDEVEFIAEALLTGLGYAA